MYIKRFVDEYNIQPLIGYIECLFTSTDNLTSEDEMQISQYLNS